jgi:hypothetical protein
MAASSCSASPVLSPTVITRIPTTPYRIRRPSTYLFAFPVSESSDGPVDVVVLLPAGRFRAGATIIVSNLSAPVSEISLVLNYVASSAPQPPGFPVTLTSYQQQTLWWIPGTGWMYAGGYKSSPAFALNANPPPQPCYFDPQAVSSYIQIKANAAMLQPLCNAYITSITGDGVNIIGSINFLAQPGGVCPGPYTSIGPGDGNTYPIGTLPNNYSNCMCNSGNLEILSNDGYNIVGTVTTGVLV